MSDKVIITSTATGGYGQPSSTDYVLVGSGIKSSLANNSIAFGGQIGSTIYEAGSVSGNVVFNMGYGNVVRATMTGDITLGLPQGLVPGFDYTIILNQDPTGGRSISTVSGSEFIFGSDPVWDLSAGGENIIYSTFDGTNLRCHGVGGGVSNGRWLYRDGVDGNITITGNTTMTTDYFCNNLIVNSTATLITDNYIIHCKHRLTNNGTIHNNGNDAVTTTSGTTKSINNTYHIGTAGGASTLTTGGAGAAGAAVAWWSGAAGGAGGASGATAGGAGGTSTYSSSYPNLYMAEQFLYSPSFITLGSAARLGNNAPGGGSGAGNGATKGGGGGSGAGGVMIVAREVINAGTISATGGRGGDGAASGCAGGGGGCGGFVFIYCDSYFGAQPTVAGGAGGTGSGAGANGNSGSAGKVFIKYNR